MNSRVLHLLPVVGIMLIVALAALAPGAAAGPTTQQATPIGPAVAPLGPTTTQFSYQGQLLDTSGDPVPDGSYDMIFKLYNSAADGTLLWTENHTGAKAVAVTDGLFHVLLGSLAPIDPAIVTGDLYLELAVGAETLSPRELLTSVAYAVEAHTVPNGSITNAKLALQGGLNLGGDGTTDAAYSGSYGNLSLRNTSGNIRTIAAGGLYYFIDSDNNTTDAEFRVLRDNGSFNSPVADVFKVNESGTVLVPSTGEFQVEADGREIRLGYDATASEGFLAAAGRNLRLTTGYLQSLSLVAGDGGMAFDIQTTSTDRSTKMMLTPAGNLSLEDNQIQNVHGLQLKDWDDDTGGTDNKYRLLGRDGAWQFYNGGVVVGAYNDGTWTDLADGDLVVESQVGIGTTSPTAKLHVNGGKVYVDNISFGGTPSIALAVGDTDTGLNTVVDGALDLYSNNIKTMSIRSGNVGIGTTTPTAKLHVNGDMRLTGSCTAGAYIEANLLTEAEQEAGGSGRFKVGDLLCWGVDRLELCATANDRLVQAVADAQGRPIVLGAEAVKVLGPVKRGDILVASAVPGYAMVNNAPLPGSVIAQALEDFAGERGLIKAMIRKW